MTAYVALGGQVGLHGHGMFDHQLGADLTKEVEGGDAGYQAVGVHRLILTV